MHVLTWVRAPTPFRSWVKPRRLYPSSGVHRSLGRLPHKCIWVSFVFSLRNSHLFEWFFFFFFNGFSFVKFVYFFIFLNILIKYYFFLCCMSAFQSRLRVHGDNIYVRHSNLMLEVCTGVDRWLKIRTTCFCVLWRHRNYNLLCTLLCKTAALSHSQALCACLRVFSCEDVCWWNWLLIPAIFQIFNNSCIIEKLLNEKCFHAFFKKKFCLSSIT